MEELKKIETGMVPVYETSTGEKVVYGTELHEVLEAKSNYREWVKRRFKDIDAVEKEDYSTVEISTLAGGTPKKEHIVKLDIAKEMAMLERNEKGKQVRRYFIELEKKYKTAQELVAKQLQNMMQFMEQQAEFNQKMMDKMDAIQMSRNGDIVISSVSDCVEDENEIIRRRKMLNQLVGRMAKACGWDRNFDLHRLYKALENALDVSLDDYREIHMAETGNMNISTLGVILEYDRLYVTAVRMCANTISSMKC